MAGQRLNLEFVSANPTGPVHIGGTRWAAVGDALGRLLTASGAEVSREYYFNDAGSQIDRFARSLVAAATGAPVPEDGYAGDYIGEIAGQVVQAEPGVLERPEPERQGGSGYGASSSWSPRSRLAGRARRRVRHVLLRGVAVRQRRPGEGHRHPARAGHVYEADGAIWLRTTDFGDDKDRVLVRSDGDHTYFAADCAYYLDKRDRGFDKVVIMLGADHAGYVGRYKALVAAIGDDPAVNLEILIGQLVNLVRDGEPLRMSKRAGTVITLEDLVDAVGVDAARYALARASVDQQIDLDLDLWSRPTNDNPVFYVQYAHARIASLLRDAADLGIDLGTAETSTSPAGPPAENDLLRALGEFPRVVTAAAQLRAPHRVARYLEQLAGTYHRFYDACRILPRGDEQATPTTSPGSGCARRRGSCCPTAWRCSVSARRSGCEGAPGRTAARESGPARRRCPAGRARRARPAGVAAQRHPDRR